MTFSVGRVSVSNSPLGSLYSGNNVVDCFLSVTVSRESNNKLALRLLTQTASGTSNVVVDCCRANDNLTTAASSKESAGFFRLYYSNCGNVMLCHNFICNLYIFSRGVNRESFRVSILQHLNVISTQRMMSVSITFATTVSINQLPNFSGINVT